VDQHGGDNPVFGQHGRIGWQSQPVAIHRQHGRTEPVEALQRGPAITDPNQPISALLRDDRRPDENRPVRYDATWQLRREIDRARSVLAQAGPASLAAHG
ncbi:MAG: hypothetical protein J0M02_16485, partial [Planctomycetes bacterium]|nr:hypothetical protein [Planctomycetota bacterium]